MRKPQQTPILRTATLTESTATLYGTLGVELVSVTVPRPLYYQLGHALPYEEGEPYHLTIMNFDPRTSGADLSTLRGWAFHIQPDAQGLAALADLHIPSPRPQL